MQNNLFPSQISDNTTEHFLSRHSNKSQIIYSTIVFAVIVVIALLPVLKVDVSVQANGIIRPVCEKNEIKSLVSGTVSEIFVSENQAVGKNAVLLELDTRVLEEKLKVNLYRLEEEENYLCDYRAAVSNYLTLCGAPAPQFDLSLESKSKSNIVIADGDVRTTLYGAPAPQFDLSLESKSKNNIVITDEDVRTTFKTKVCLREWLLFKNQLKENFNKLEELEKELGRLRPLFEKKIISTVEFEAKEFEFKQLKIQKELLVEQQLGKWHSEILSRQLKFKQFTAEREQFEKEKELSTICSPVGGTLEQFSGLAEGSYVQVGQTLAIISPDSDLIAEMYVAPKDIGLIQKKAKASFQVDAFNYNQWGMIKGKIKNISDDFLQFDNQPMFRVRCKLDKNYLELKNGYKGRLKKGMTLRARFLVTRRSLFQLLYDKVDDWLNPTID